MRAGAHTIRCHMFRRKTAPVFVQMDSGERRKIDCSSGVQQGDAMGPALFCLPLLPVLKRNREDFEPKGVEAFAYLDDVSIGRVEVTSDTVDVVPFLQRGLASIGIAMNPSKTVALPPKGHAPTLDEIALLESIDVRVVERSGVKVVGVPIGTDAYAMEIVKNGGGEQLARDAAAHARQAVSQRGSHWLHSVPNSLHRASDGPGVIQACMPKGRQQRDVDVGKPN